MYLPFPLDTDPAPVIQKSRLVSRGTTLALLTLIVLVGPFANAESPTPPLSLEQAIEAALRGNPSLQDFSFRLRAQDARTQQAALRPPTEVAVTLENFAGSGDNRRLDGVEATLALSQVVELGGKRDARIAASGAARDLLMIERQAEQLDVLAEVTRRFIAVAIRQEQVKLAQTAMALAEKTVHNSELRVRAARSPHVEVDRAQVALSRAQLEERRAASELEAARRQLSATWGEADATLLGQPFFQVSANLFQLPKTGSFESFSKQLASSPDLTRFASTARLREAEFRLTSTLRRPDLQFSVGVRRLQATQDQALVASFSIPLFAPRRAAPFVAESESLRDLVGVDRRAAEIKAQATLFELFQALSQAVLEAKSLHDDTLPRIAEALKETEYAYGRGRYGYLELVDAQREYLSVQAAMIAASGDAHKLRAEIERLANAPLTSIPVDAEMK